MQVNGVSAKIDKQKLVHLLMSCCPGKTEPLLMRGHEAKKMVCHFLKMSGLSIDEAHEIFAKPRYFLGDFSDLPESLRLTLSASASFCDQEYLLTNLSSIRRFTLIPIWKIGSIFFSIYVSFKNRINNENQFKSLYQTLFMKVAFGFGYLLTSGAVRFSKKIVDRIRFSRLYKQPFFNALWSYLNTNTKELCYSYINSIPVHPALGPIYQYKDISVACAVIVGIDLLPSSGELYFLETNFNPGIHSERLHLYNGNDPLGHRLIQYALSRDFKHLALYGSDFPGNVFDKDTEQLWEKIARERGVSFKVVDNLFAGHLRYRDAKIEIEFLSCEDTLNILVRGPRNHALAALISEKGNLENLIEEVTGSLPIEDRVTLPKRFIRPGEVLGRQVDERFPNLIIKDRRKDRTTGIELFNVGRVPEGYSTDDFIISEYIVPNRVKRASQGRLYEFICVYRSHILLTTDGPVYLGTYRVRSGTQIPHYLPNGKVEDIRPYVANRMLGGAYEKVNSEDALCQKVSVNIGEIISRFVSQKLLVEVERCRHLTW